MLETVALQLVRYALSEDVGTGDITSLNTIKSGVAARAAIVSKARGVVAGLDVARLVFREADPALRFRPLAQDGDRIESGAAVAQVVGDAGSIFKAERTALNFLQRLSGVATATRRAVDALASGGGKTRLLDTRKTTPGWRRLEKDAVLAGGGSNHRFSLGDGILIKDNHVAACGGVAEAVRRARSRKGALLKVEVEVVDLPGLDAAIAAGADIVLLDNMDDAALAEAVRRAAGRVLLEASGNMTRERLPRVAATGVDFVSMGAITHGARAVDISFEVVL